MPPSELIFEAGDSGGGAPDLLRRNWLMNRSNRYSTVLGCTWGSRVPQEARQQRENLHSTPLLLYVFRESPFLGRNPNPIPHSQRTFCQVATMKRDRYRSAFKMVVGQDSVSDDKVV
jgi:hypothetical protein